MLEEIKRLRAIAETGLLYSANAYDKERYTELYELSFGMLQNISDREIADLKIHLPLGKDYPTAKPDIRGMLISPEKKLLLVRESADGKWSLPGGWGDIGFSPKEVVVKEFKEETGLDVSVDRLLAVFDKKMHPHPPQPFYVYKMVFLCTALSTEIVPGFDVLDVAYFDINALPELSQDRILQSQIETLFSRIAENNEAALFD